MMLHNIAQMNRISITSLRLIVLIVRFKPDMPLCRSHAKILNSLFLQECKTSRNSIIRTVKLPNNFTRT